MKLLSFWLTVAHATPPSSLEDTGSWEAGDVEEAHAGVSPQPIDLPMEPATPRIALLSTPVPDIWQTTPLFRLESFHSGEVVTHVAMENATILRAGTEPGAGVGAGDLRIWLSPEHAVDLRGLGVARGVDGSATWMGRPEADALGLAVLTPTTDGMVGIVQAGGHRWEVRHLGGGVAQVVEHLDVPSAGSGCGLSEEAVVQGSTTNMQAVEASFGTEFPTGPVCDYDPDAGQVDLLVILTHGGRDEAGTTDLRELWAIMQNRLEWGNAALRSSGVAGSVRMVELMVIDLGRASPATRNDRLNVHQIRGCLLDPAQSHCPAQALFMGLLRDTVGADLVAVITDGIAEGETEDTACPADFNVDTDADLEDDSDADTDIELGCDNDDQTGEPHVGALACVECGVVGLASLFQEPTQNGGCLSGPQEDEPWLVVQYEAGWNSLLHEIGHQLGAGHGLWQPSPLDVFGDNTAWLAPDCTFHTIMGAGPFEGTACDGEDPDDIPFFSSACVRAAQPDTSGLPQPIGDDAREN